MGLKAKELESGCFAKAKDDEPMFVLLGRDMLAPVLVRLWAKLHDGFSRSDISAKEAETILEMLERAFEDAVLDDFGELLEQTDTKSEEARALAEMMERYSPRKWPSR